MAEKDILDEMLKFLRVVTADERYEIDVDKVNYPSPKGNGLVTAQS